MTTLRRLNRPVQARPRPPFFFPVGIRAIAAVLLSLAASGCDSGRPEAAPQFSYVDASSQPTATMWDAGEAADYPGGPYALTVGATAPNILFQGVDGEIFDLDTLRDRPGVRVIVWSEGAGWCSICAGERSTLDDVQTAFGSEVVVLQSLFHDDQFGAPAPSYLESWRGDDGYLVARSEQLYSPRRAVPATYVLDAESMRIRWTSNANLENAVSAALDIAERPFVLELDVE